LRQRHEPGSFRKRKKNWEEVTTFVPLEPTLQQNTGLYRQRELKPIDTILYYECLKFVVDLFGYGKPNVRNMNFKSAPQR